MKDFQGAVIVLKVVGRHLGNDKNGGIRAYLAGTDCKILIHGSSSLPYNFSA